MECKPLNQFNRKVNKKDTKMHSQQLFSGHSFCITAIPIL